MKKIFVLYILLLTLSLIMTGCDNGSASDSVSSSNLVKVSLTVGGDSSRVSQRSVSVTGDDWADFTYKYNAVPQWSGSNIQGAVGWTAINYSDGMSLGYFSPGRWVFGVQILRGDTVVYQGYSDVTDVANSSVRVNVLVNKLVTEATIGSVRISLTAPTVNNENLSISFTGSNGGTASGGPYDATVSPSAEYEGRTQFDYTVSNLSAGSYTFTLSHPSGSSGATVAFDLAEGEAAVISGHLDNGIWQVGYITVKVHSVVIDKNSYGTVALNLSPAAVGDRVAINVEPFSGSSVQTLLVKYGSNPETSFQPTRHSNNLFSFIMPDADVTVYVRFKSVDLDISVSFFKSLVQGLYDSHLPTKFGRSETPPEVECMGVRDVKAWYDEDDDKIYWYSPDNNNTLKFKSGSLAEFFKGCENYEEISLEGIDTSEITDMSSLFENCYNLKAVDLAGVNTSKVTNMSKMFYKAGYHYFPNYETGVTKESNTHEHIDNTGELVISNMSFDTSKVLNMSYMFSLCAITSISSDLTNWDVSKVTDMSYMFAGDWKNKSGYWYWYNKITNFNDVDISGWNTISCTSFRNMFAFCNRFTELDISGWKFDNVLYVDRMFERCECLGMVATQGNAADDIKLIFPRTTNLNKVQDMLYMFGKAVEFRRENLADIVSTWLIADNPNLVSLFGNNSNTDTTLETVPSNRILASDNLSNTKAHYRKNFKTQVSMTTKDGITLYVGGSSGIFAQRLSTENTSN